MRPAASDSLEPVPGGSGRSVLIVEGDECMRELLHLHLSNAGYRVLIAEDAVVAARLLLREPPDLILADIDMPYLDGLEFLAALREDGGTRHVPLVFLTTGDVRVERALALGAQAYLTKPILAGRLLHVVAEQLSRARFEPVREAAQRPPPS